MKSMEEYINEVYEKYEQSEKQHEKYKKVRMKPYNPLPTLCGIAACIALICVVSVGMKFYNIEEKQEIKYASTEEKEDGTIVYTNVLWVDGFLDETYLKKMIDRSNLIAIVSEFNIKDITYSFVRNNFMIKNIGNLNLNKTLYIDRKLEKRTIDCSNLCGKIAISEIAKDDNIDIEQWEKLYIGKTLDIESRDKAYFQQIPSKGCNFEPGKQYLVFLSYNEEDDIYEIFDIAYGIMEYNPITNQVKNVDTGKFEDFDWELISQEKGQ